MALPVVMYGIPPRPWHVNVLNTASVCNPKSLYFLSNCDKWHSLRGFNASAWKCVNATPTRWSDEIASLHPGPPRKHPNPKAFEMASIVRWVFVYQFAERKSLARFLFVDCDVLIFSSISATLSDQFRTADSLTLGRNGAMSVWSLRGIREFAHFLVRVVRVCDANVLSHKYAVDMSLIKLWQRPQLTNASVPIDHCNASVHATGARVAHFETSLRSGYWVGDVNAPKQKRNASRNSVSCASSDNLAVAPRTAFVKHPNASFGTLAVVEAYDFAEVCSPFVMDVCSKALLPVHMAHYTGRYKAWLSARRSVPHSRCKCVRQSGALIPTAITNKPGSAQSLLALTI